LSDEILKNKEALIARFPKDAEPCYSLNILLDFISNFNRSAGKDRTNTRQCYEVLNELILYCFYPKGKALKFDINHGVKNRYGKDDHEQMGFTRGIKLVGLDSNDYLEIILLLEYFERKIFQLKKADPKQTENSGQKESPETLTLDMSSVRNFTAKALSDKCTYKKAG
jgi:hypothetical protein